MDTLEETAAEVDAFEEETAVEGEPVATPQEPATPVQAVLERLSRAGVEARAPEHRTLPPGRSDRRGDTSAAVDFDQALALLRGGDLERAFYAFTKLLERRPDSTRLWIFVRAIAQTRDTWT